MGMGEAIGLFFSRYTDFQGRSRRAEYWWYYLAVILVSVVFGVLLGLLGGFDSSGELDLSGPGMIIVGIGALLGLAIIIPSIALAVRRFHDLGQTGWLVLVFGILGAIPLIGILATIGQLIWFAMPGTVGPNQYGPDPKGGHDVDVFS